MNNVVIITGAGRGIGAATAKLLAKRNYKVCINYLNNEKAAMDVYQHIHANGGAVLLYKANAAIESEVESMFQAVNEHFGAVTHLVNNVGVLFEKARFEDISPQRFMRVFSNNVLSAFICSQVFVKQNPKASAIVNVSSAASRTGSPFEYIDYASSKGAIDTLTRGLSIELAAKNIRVNCVRPGFINTEIHADGGEPNRVNRLAPNIPLKRGGEPWEVANAIAWLLSEEASYVTGSFIDIAGGV